MARKYKKWAFIQPALSRGMSEYYAGMLEFLKYHPEVLLDVFTFDEADANRFKDISGIISYSVPPPELIAKIKAANGGQLPPAIMISMCDRAPEGFARAYIDPFRIADIVADKFVQRNCRSFAFCSSHTKHLTHETARLLLAFRRAVWNRTQKPPKLYCTIKTTDMNLIPTEVERFAEWTQTMEKPCGLFVHGDDVAKKVLDTCRLFDINVPCDFRVIGTGNSAVFCERTIPTLSSYAVSHEDVGFNTAKLLARMIREKLTPSEVTYNVPLPALNERASTHDKHGRGRLTDLARKYIQQELDRGHAPTSTEIAHHLNISRAKIMKDFKDVMGHSMHAEMASYRLERLARLLRASNEPAKVIFRRVGFSSPAQAKHAFLLKFGMTMREYRRKLQEQNPI